jgi:hypothetical protein
LNTLCWQALGEGFTGSDLINSRYGSHVLRQLISLCSGIPIETLSKSGAGGKGNNSLAERLGTKGSKFKGGGAARLRGHRFGDQLHMLVGGPALQVRPCKIKDHCGCWYEVNEFLLRN